MRAVFMGTPEFAVKPFEALLDAGIEIVACCTQPDRPVGRGGKMAISPVKKLALERGVPVLQFERIRRAEGVEALADLAPDLCITAAFGQILSQKLLDIPRLGTVNLHASLLPKYRGPAPINWCIIEGETITGVTTMMTDAGVDSGDILLSREAAILPDERAGELSARLSAIGAELLVETVRRVVAGDCPRTPQDHSVATRHPMLEKAHGRIDWSKTAQEITNLVRGVDPWPGAWTTIPGGVLKIWDVRPTDDPPQSASRLIIPCGSATPARGGALEVLELQAPGGKRMCAADYLRGHALRPEDIV